MRQRREPQALDSTAEGRGTAYLVGAAREGVPPGLVASHLDELSALADTAGFEEAGRAIVHLRQVHAATFIGRGQAGDVGAMAHGLGASVIVVDEELTPAQVRNLEAATGLPVVDRAGLIIEIFAQRARSREARTQVELARLEYLLPRLAGRWTHLSRQVGGGPGGTKGEGEKQIELDRRIIRRRIDRLRRELRRIESARRVRRSGRRGLPRAALVGYTNVGKSSLFNAIVHAGVHVEDRLFATLDPTVRCVETDPRGLFLLKDTVGFIRKLPHHLVASFRSTFEESADSDLLVLVADASHPAVEAQVATVESVLDSSGLADRPRLLVLNKIDAASADRVHDLSDRWPGALLASARTGAGVDQLVAALGDRLLGETRVVELAIPENRPDLLAAAHRAGRVERCEQVDGELRIRLRARERPISAFEGRLAAASGGSR
ncbi:MAG: GTPase HflX [Acidobacteria bacterium]|nr:MAG: GTPase HflX [Acidobacteriota bacterium]